MSTPVLYLYNLDNPRGAKIRRMCLPLGIRTKLVPPEAQAMTVGDLVAGAEPAADAVPAFDDEMLLLADFTSAKLDALLMGFHRAKIQPVALKAVLTATNRGWTSAQLHGELKKEHQAVMAGRRAEHDNVGSSSAKDSAD